MNHFANMQRRVTEHKAGVYNRPANRPTDLSAVDKAIYVQESTTWKTGLETKIQGNSVKEYASELAQMKIYGKRLNVAVENAMGLAREDIFKKILCEMYTGALNLDTDFIDQERTTLESFVNNYVDSNGGFKLLTEAVNRHSEVPLLKAMLYTCNEGAAEYGAILHESAKKAKLDPSDVKYCEDDTIMEKVRQFKTEVDMPALSEAVKNKVLSVVMDEKNRQAQEKELADALKDASKEELQQLESFRIRKTGKILRETSLFVAIMENAYREALTENTTTILGNYDNDVDVNNYNVNQTEDEFNEEHSDIRSNDIDMDEILAETVAKYTLLEMVNFIRLEDYNADSCRKMINNLLYSK